MKDLPKFHRRPREAVLAYLDDVLTNPRADRPGSALVMLEAFDDGHYRAVFHLDYFVVAEGRAEPSRSQWSTLKKKMKRHHPGVFVFKEHGIIPAEGDADPLGYVDFGFFAERRE